MSARWPRTYDASMSASVASEERVHFTQATARPYFLIGLSALSVGAAVVHFAVTFEHFREYALYGAFFLIISWAQLIWPTGRFAAAAASRPSPPRRPSPSWSSRRLPP
jgi:hypothetical protein